MDHIRTEIHRRLAVRVATRYIKEFRSFHGILNYDRKLLRQHPQDDGTVIAFIKQDDLREIIMEKDVLM